MSILTELHDSEINAAIESFVDGAWRVRLGDHFSGVKEEATVDSEAKAYDWLERKALEHYPNSRWALVRSSNAKLP